MNRKQIKEARKAAARAASSKYHYAAYNLKLVSLREGTKTPAWRDAYERFTRAEEVIPARKRKSVSALTNQPNLSDVIHGLRLMADDLEAGHQDALDHMLGYDDGQYGDAENWATYDGIWRRASIAYREQHGPGPIDDATWDALYADLEAEHATA